MTLALRRFAALAALLAIGLQSLWPLIAHAKPRVAGELVPVCTINSITHYLELPAGKTPLEQRSASHGEHCQLCVFGNGKAAAIVSSPAVSVFSFEKTFVRTESRSIPAAEATDHPPAQPRAPPVVL